MLSHHNRLLFPRLRRLGEAQLVHPSGNQGSTRGLYQLDWDRCDAIKLDDHYRWANDQHPGKDLPFTPTLPPVIDETVKHQFYALDEAYLSTIRSHARMAVEVWGRRYRMDTLARERAMGPADALVWSALWLLGDCAYDPETHYYVRTPTKIVLPHAMAWKLWAYQTGRGCLWRKARMDDLEDRRENCKGDGPDLHGMIDDFIDRMKVHQDEFYAAYDALTAGKDGENQPCIVTPPETPDQAPKNQTITCPGCKKDYVTSDPIDKAQCPHCQCRVQYPGTSPLDH